MSSPIPTGALRRILVVDDDLATRAVLKRFFVRAGYEVTAVGTFAEGRLALSQSTFDLLIADVRLGEFNGLQLIAANPRPIPTIVVTGYRDSVLEADARDLGADYLIKPVSATALLALVKHKLEGTGDSAPVVGPRRRWPRRPIDGELPVRIGDAPVRVLDISYGGLRFEVQPRPDQAIPPSFTIVLPVSGISVPADLVWTVRQDGSWMCGAAIVAGEAAAAFAWQQLVDQIGP